jgi:cytochrome c5
MRPTGIHRLGFSSALLLCSGALVAPQQERDVFGLGRAHAEPDSLPRTAAPHWAVDPADAGSDRPASGRSLFDVVVNSRDGSSHEIPFPIEALIERIQRSAGCSTAHGGCIRQVLIPLGRSLQRTAAQAQGFFASPRLVIAVDREPASGQPTDLQLRDRLFLGYQAASGLIEVISYNEAAARFEFQIVRDYRAGATPRLVYANRALCTACHQNQAPLFSRPQWDETHANPRIAQRLAALQSTFYGMPARGAISEPEAIDNATDRASRLAVTQRLWWEGCGERAADARRCRAAAVLAAIQYRLSDERGFASSTEFAGAVTATLVRNAQQRWPGGLALPNSDIPNRDPLNDARDAQAPIMADVAAELEALAPRAPAEVWSPNDPLLARHFVVGLADALGRNEINAVERGLARLAAGRIASQQVFSAACTFDARRQELRFACRPAAEQSGVQLQGRVASRAGNAERGELETFAISGDEPQGHFEVYSVRVSRERDESVVSFLPQSHGHSARLPDGRAIARIELRARGAAGTARLIASDDLAPLRDAVSDLERRSDGSASDPLAALAFDQTLVIGAVAARLGEPLITRRGSASAAMPAAVFDSERARNPLLPPAAKPFERACGACHGGPDRSPPNFLYGDEARVQAALESCAPRIFARLRMWDLAPEQRVKTPMPPAHAVLDGAALHVHEGTPRDVAPLQAAAERLFASTSGHAPALGELLARGYEELRPCLPAGR